MGALKMYAQREDMKLTDLVLTAVNQNNNGDISSVTLYADDGVTQLSNPITNSGATYTFASSDFLNDIVVSRNSYKTILVKANVGVGLDTATNVKFTVAATAGHLKFIGQDSGTAYDYADSVGAVDFEITSPYAGGKFSSYTKVVVIEKASTSPSGSISRGSQSTTAVWDVVNHDSTNAASVFTAITFTSKTGLPSGLDNTDGTDDALFSLYDGDGTLLAGGAGGTAQTTIDKTAGTVAFAKAAMLTVNSGEPKQLKLVIDTTNTAKFPSSTQMQWSLEAVGDATVTNGAVGYAAGTWTIPAVANVVKLP